MYGFSISKAGILTNNYYKQLGYYEKPEPQGVYVMIRKNGNEIIINQDFYGSFGLYIYENKENNYFVFSNSFLYLEKYLIGKHNISFNKEFADNLIISSLYSYSINETMIKEIKQLPRNIYIIINIQKKSFKLKDIDYKENTIPLESKEGIKIIDQWVDKWGYIFRSLKKKTGMISCDLSGGFDTRTVFSILLNSGLDLNEILIKSAKDKKYVHAEDFNIAGNISSKIGFKLNNLHFNNNETKLSLRDSLSCTMYSKLGFHKEFYLKKNFFNNPIFSITGNGGEDLRGSPGYRISNYIEKVSSRNIPGHIIEFYNSSKALIGRSIDYLKQKKNYSNDYEISYDLYSRIVGRNHFGRSALEAFLVNNYIIQPLMDPDIKRIKYDIIDESPHDLIAFIYIRFAKDLLHFPFQGNRTLNSESIRKGKNLNDKLIPYIIKSDYNKNFFIDIKRKYPTYKTKDNKKVEEILNEIFKSNEFFRIIKKTYDEKLYYWSKDYSKKTNYHPLKHENALLSIVITAELISLNKRDISNRQNIGNNKNELKILNYIILKK